VPNLTPNTWRPRLHPRLAIEVAQIARAKRISPERALIGVIQAGICAMSGFPVVPVQQPAPRAESESA
jgi:hypothetical protein